jgi:hypothetical protein
MPPTRTRCPNSPFDDDRINIHPFHNRISELSQTRPTQFVWTQGDPMHMETAQNQFTVIPFNLGHNEQFSDRSKDMRCNHRIIG